MTLSNSKKSLILDKLPEEIYEWNPDHVPQFFRQNMTLSPALTLEDIDLIAAQKIDGPTLLTLDKHEIQKWGITGHGPIQGVLRIIGILKQVKNVEDDEQLKPEDNMETDEMERGKIDIKQANIQQYWKDNWGSDLPDNVVCLPERGERETGGISSGVDQALIDAEGADAVTAEIDFDQADLLPGPPFLSANIFTGLERYLVRAEYLRIYNFLKQVSDEYTQAGRTLPPVAVLTGQPGIGKTFFIRYGIVRCLAAKQHVLYCATDWCQYFSAAGVREVKGDDLGALLREEHRDVLWVFIDSANAPNGLPLNMVGEFSGRIFIIYTTSPKKSRWASLHQSKKRHLIIMNPWSWEEIDAVKSELYPAGNIDDIRHRFDDIGPTARICLDYSHTEIDHLLTDRNWAIEDMDLKKVAYAAMNGDEKRHEAGLQLGDSHKICLVRRAERHNVSSLAVVKFISTQVEQLVAARLFVLSEEAIVQLWSSLKPFPNAHGLTGVVFEVYCHRHLRRRMRLDAEPMFKFKSFHALFSDLSSNPKLLAAQNSSRAGADAKAFRLNFQPKAFRVYEGGASLQPDIYYQLKISNEPALDSFIIHDDILYIFQITCGAAHGINRKLLETLEKHHELPGQSDWRLIFVAPDTLKAFSCPDPDKAIRFITSHLYTARLTVGNPNDA